MPPPKLEFPGFEKSGGENASHMDLGGGGGGGEHIYIYICFYVHVKERFGGLGRGYKFSNIMGPKKP